MNNYLTDAQMAQLLRGIRAERVSSDARGNAHVEAYEIRAHLNRIFGHGRWDEEVLEQALVFESSSPKVDKKTGKPIEGTTVWTVCWRSIVRLTIRTPSGETLCTYTEGATCDASNQPVRADAHDQALKGSASQALKRCAMNLGDQFGLSLYNKGSLRPLVLRTLIWSPPEEEAQTEQADVEAHITAPLAPENDTTELPQRETSSPGPDQGAAGRAESEPTGQADESPAAGTKAPSEADDEFDLILAQINLVSSQTPATAMQTIKDCMERATRAGIGNRKIPGENMTLSARLQALLRYAARAANTTQEVAS